MDRQRRPQQLAALGLALLGLCASAACSGDSAGITLVYPDSPSEARANTLSLYVFRPANNLCAQLVQKTNPLSPDSPSLVREAAAERVPVGARLDVLEGLPSGELVFYAEGHDAGGTRFLAGCIQGRLGDGAKLRIELTNLDPEAVMPDGGPADAGPDAMPDSGPLPKHLEVVVSSMTGSPSVSVAKVVASDGTSSATGTTTGGSVVLDVTDLIPPLTVTAVADSGTLRGATTLVGIEPSFTGSDPVVRLPIDFGPLAQTGSGTISGSISGLSGHDAVVRAISPFAGPFETSGTGGTYAIANLPSTTYSLLMVQSNGGTVVAVDAAQTVGLVDTATHNFAANQAPVDISASVQLSTSATGLSGPVTFETRILQPLGPLPIESLTDPGTSFSAEVPDLGDLAPGTQVQYFVSRESADQSVYAEARSEDSNTATGTGADLTLPVPPSISVPAPGATLTLAVARALTVQIGNLFTGHDFVQVHIEGIDGGDEYRWNLFAPPGTATVPLPALPPGSDIMQSGVDYSVTVTAQEVPGSFDYGTDIYDVFTDFTGAFNIPALSRRTNAFSVQP